MLFAHLFPLPGVTCLLQPACQTHFSSKVQLGWFSLRSLSCPRLDSLPSASCVSTLYYKEAHSTSVLVAVVFLLWAAPHPAVFVIRDDLQHAVLVNEGLALLHRPCSGQSFLPPTPGGMVCQCVRAAITEYRRASVIPSEVKSEKQILYIKACMWNLEKQCADESIARAGTNTQSSRMDMWTQQGKERWDELGDQD